jgi:hypothetical protein
MFQFVNYPHTMWAKDADGNSILQIKSESDHDLLSQAAASIKQVKNIQQNLKLNFGWFN